MEMRLYNICTQRPLKTKSKIIRLTRRYRTISYLPVTVISNIVPIDYQIVNRTVTYNKIRNLIPTFPIERTVSSTLHKKSEITQYSNNKTHEEWQNEWNNCDKGKWTKELIPRISEEYIPTGLRKSTQITEISTNTSINIRLRSNQNVKSAIKQKTPQTPIRKFTGYEDIT